MHRSTWPLYVLLVLCGIAPLPAQERALTLAEAVRLAAENNPEVRTMAAEVAAAQARVEEASLLLPSNPSLTVTAGPRSSSAGDSRDESIQLLQQLDLFGQRRARIEATRAQLDAAQARLQALRADVAARAREGFGRALAAEQRVRLASEVLSVAREGVSAAEERFDAGAATLLEVNTARVELGRMSRDLGAAERGRAEALAALNLLLGLDPASTVAPQGELRAGEPAPPAAELFAQALANRAEVAAGQSALDAARAEARLASREWLPSPRVGVNYAREEESSASIVQGVVSFELPLIHRGQAARGVAAARVAQAETALETVQRQVRQEVSTALARLQAARGAAEGYAGDVVKAMQENMELASESFRAGKIDFLQLMLIRRQALDARREYIDVLEELNAAQAQLERALGRTP